MRRSIEFDRDQQSATGIAIGGFGPLLVGAALVPFRDHLAGANEALVFVLFVVLAAAAAGGRGTGALAALMSALSYDFFLTRPYGSLKIERAEEIETAVLLLIISLCVAEIVAFARRSHGASLRSREEVTRLRRVSDLVAGGASAAEVIDVTCRELTELLGLEVCRFEPTPTSHALPRIERNGTLNSRRHAYVGAEFALPDTGAEIVVLGRGETLGRMILVPGHAHGVTLEARGVAIALVDQLGAALFTKS